jgi:arabinofuranan 3-O-arabinosyltransferase
VLRRVVDLEHDREMAATVTVRLDRRAADGVLADLWGADLPTSDNRLLGAPGSAAWAALDGDPETRWMSAFGGSVGATLSLPSVPAGTDRIVISQPTDPRLSRITAVDVHTADGTQRVELSDPQGRSVLRIPPTAGPIRISVAAVDARTTVDRRTFDVVETPVAITEIEIRGLDEVDLPARLDTGCRDDLVAIDGSPLDLRIVASTDDLLAGRPVTAELCDAGPRALSAGRVSVETTSGHGLQVDQVVLAPPGGLTTADGDRPGVEELSRDRTSRVAEVGACPEGCWFVQAEGANPGWTATVDGQQLGSPQVVDGGMSGWWLSPSDAPREVRTSWGPQRRVDIAIALSALLALVVVVLVLRDRRPSPAPVRDDMVIDTRGRSLARRAGVLWSAGAAIASWLVLGPGVGAAVLLVSAGTLVVLRRPRVLAGLGVAGVAVISVIVVSRVRNDAIPPDFSFPAAFEDLHRPLAAAVVLVVLAVFADTRRRA